MLAALLAAAAWIPFLRFPLGSDESGFLLLARHWHHGTSLYGNYWVDRPPLLLWLFALAGHLSAATPVAGGIAAPGVKVLGAGATAASVVLAALLTRVVGVPEPTGSAWSVWTRRAAVWLVVLLLISPHLGMPEVDGELLALPFVLAGLLCLVVVLRAGRSSTAAAAPGSTGRTVLVAAAAGAFGMGAALVKQNVIDVFVFAGVAWVVALTGQSRRTRGVWVSMVAFVLGASAALGAALAGAAARGTSPAGLWGAVVVFRFRATAVIGSSASSDTSQRLGHVLVAAVQSGAAALLVITVALVLSSASRRGRGVPRNAADGGPDLVAPDLTWPVIALVAWEVCGVVLGGSYWLHYLTGLVPGLVLLVCITPPGRWAGRLLVACLGYATVANLWVWTQHATGPPAASIDTPVISYLRAHAAATDGVVVAFGHPDIVAGAGLDSPYPELWSLPARVRDPALSGLRRVLAGPHAPRWVVVGGSSLATWGVDADSAQRYLARHYVERVDTGDWTIWQRRGVVDEG